MISNQQVAQKLEEMASALEVKEANSFRIRAYQNAANNIKQLDQPLHNLWEKEALDDVPGLGENLKKYLDELFRTGEVEHFKKTIAQLPTGMSALLPLEGVGAKTAFTLASTFELPAGKKAIDKLYQLAQQHQIRNLPNFGEKSEQDIITAIEMYRDRKPQRMLISKAWPIAQEITSYLEKSEAVQAVQVLGSLRRRRSTTGDIDIAVCTDHPEAVMKHLKKYKKLQKTIVSGPKMTTFVHSLGPQIDVKTQNQESWGSMLQHFTGSKYHNVQLRQLAIKKGYSMSEYGLKKIKSDKRLTFEDESELYQHLGLEFIPPTLRENRGEIAVAKKNQLPQLVQLKDIKGDLHVHTDLDYPTSHDRGESSLAKLLTKAHHLGYEYLGLTDHNPPQNGMSAQERLEMVKDRTTKLQQMYKKWKSQSSLQNPPHLLIGLEVDIRPDGSLALENESLQELDYVIASIHSSHKQSSSEATQRILKAINNPYVSIIGHPTGRLINKRSAIEADWEKVFTAAAKQNVIMEINASPSRQDLPDQLVKIALEKGVKICINTDSHQVDGLDYMQYGVWVAQRGWSQPANIINTLPFTKLKKTLQH